MRRFFLTCVVLSVSTGCALRPRYRDFISDTTPGPDAKFVLSEKGSDRKVGGAKIEMSEWKNKVFVTTAADGSFALPVDKKYLDENPVLVVNLPAGMTGYEIEPVSAPAPEQPQNAVGAPPADQTPGPAPSTSPADQPRPASNK